MNIDVSTVMLIYAIVNFVCAIIIFYVWRFNRKRFSGLSFWFADMIMQTIGSILILLRGIIPDYISYIIANLLIIAGILIIFIGLGKFLKRRSIQIQNYIIIFIFICLQVFFTYFKDLVVVRNIIISAAIFLLTSQCFYLLYFRASDEMKKAAKLAGIVFLSYAVISIIRIFLLIAFPPQSSDFFKTGMPDVVILIFYIMLAIALNFGLILMLNMSLIGQINNYMAEKEKTAAKLEESNKKIQNYLDIAEVMILVLNSDQKIALINRKGCEILEAGEKDLIGKNWFDEFIPQKSRSRTKSYFSGIIKRNLAFKKYNENPVLTAKGKIKLIAWHNVLIKSNNNEISEVLSCGVDITHKKKTEEDLLRSIIELKRSNSELEQFASIASHDLQEPLRVIVSYTQLLKKRYKSLFNKDANEFMNYIVSAAKRMQQLIEDILKYSKLGSKSINLEIVDTKDIVSSVLNELKHDMLEKKAVVNFENLPEIIADPLQIFQLFKNLIDNALKYHSEEVLKINIAAFSNASGWIFYVKDNGIGIDSKYHERIFNIFERLHTEDYPGTGIGLAICRKIVENYGGKIWVESEEGAGSTFYFSLPLKR